MTLLWRGGRVVEHDNGTSIELLYGVDRAVEQRTLGEAVFDHHLGDERAGTQTDARGLEAGVDYEAVIHGREAFGLGAVNAVMSNILKVASAGVASGAARPRLPGVPPRPFQTEPPTDSAKA